MDKNRLKCQHTPGGSCWDRDRDKDRLLLLPARTWAGRGEQIPREGKGSDPTGKRGEELIPQARGEQIPQTGVRADPTGRERI